MKKKICILSVLFFIITSVSQIHAQNGLSTELLKDNWAIQSSEKVTATGSEISQTGFKTKGWYPATMPSTILETLVKNGVYKDPYYGNNLTELGGYFPVNSSMYLYDLPEDSPFSVPWWFRTEFELSEGDDHIWLNLSSINYKANIWLNGSLVANTNDIEGAHRLYELDITDQVARGRTNCLAIEIVTPVNGTDMSIRWMQGSRMVPDKDAGIWYDVKIVKNGAIKIRYPHVITDFNLPDTITAYVTVRADLYNNTGKTISGMISGKITPVNNLAEGGSSAGGSEMYEFSDHITLQPEETKKVKFDVTMNNPGLWWPHLSGKQNLYDLQLVANDESNQLSDKSNTRFGVREITSNLEDFFPEVEQKLVRVFQVNGKDIFVKGGNWTETVMMEENPERNEAEIKSMLNMNFNAIRTEGFWGTDHFFDLCDKYGIMIFDGFNCCSIWERWDAWSERSYEIAGLSFRDQVIRKRNHPSFVDWLLASDSHVPFRAEKMYVDIVEKYDGTRPYQSNSMYSTTPICGCTGIDHDPYPDTYIYLHPTTFYGLREMDENGDFGPYEFLEFNTEIGPGGEQIPPMESMRAMMPEEDLWPMGKSWEIRQSSDAYSVNATNAFNSRYGKPADLESYTVKAQVFQKESFRAMVEAFRKNKYKASGILIYRVNAGWPSLCYFLYDYNLRPNGGYSGVQQGFEPLHVQYSYDDSSVVVVNDLYRDFSDLTVSATVLNFDMTEKYTQTVKMDIGADAVQAAFTLPLSMEGLSDTYFLNLKIENQNNQLISSNFYWLSTSYDTEADFSELMTLPTTKLDVEAKLAKRGEHSGVSVRISNPTGKLAFFINPKILKGLHGEELLPAYWNAKYISLLPGETREIQVSFDDQDLKDLDPYLLLEGWNIDPVELSLLNNREVTPAFAYSKVEAPKSIKQGEEVTIRLSVKNSAKSGSGLLKSRQFLFIDDEPVSYKRVALAPGEEKQLSWTLVKNLEKGDHTIGVGDMKPFKLVVK